MPASLKYQSPIDKESVVLVTKDSNWTNIKVYAYGSLQYQSSNSDEIRFGKRINIKEFGVLYLKLDSELEVSVNKTKYEFINTDNQEKLANIASIFWALVALNTFDSFTIFSIPDTEPENIITLKLWGQIFLIAVFGTTAYLLKRKVYWFYFIGTGLFTMYVTGKLILFETTSADLNQFLQIAVKVGFLVIILRYLPAILKKVREKKNQLKTL